MSLVDSTTGLLRSVRKAGYRSKVKVQRGLRYSRFYMDYIRSRRSDIDTASVRSVCLALGPYRNLTTLTSSIIALHPVCQVLNHAGGRVFPIKDVNFLWQYSDAKFDNFIKYAIYLSGGGRRGGYGGSITLSHAFDHDSVTKLYHERYGTALVKENIQCLFWKDSMRISNFIKYNNINLNEIFSKNIRLKFLMPIRNPMDCAVSNYGTGHGNFLVSHFYSKEKNYTLEILLDKIIKEIAWFVDLHRKYPERFFYFLENEFSENTMVGLAQFLNVGPENRWINDSLSLYNIKPSYSHSPEFVEYYNHLIKTHLSECPSVAENLVKFSALI